MRAPVPSPSITLGFLALAITLVAACTSPTPAPPTSSTPATDDALEAAFTSTADRYGIPSAVAGVWVEGEDPWITTSGGLSQDDHFPIRSVTKSFTVTLILQLVNEGKLTLDDVIATYVDGVPNGDTITLAQLAGMTSGLPDYSQNPEFQQLLVADLGRQYAPDELLAYGLSQEPLFEPGADFAYSNTNTLLLGKVVQEVTGKPLAKEYRTRLLDPLDLAQTSYPDDANIPDPHPAPFQLDEETGEFEELPVLNLSALGASGGMVSTLDDMHVWGEALGSGQLVGAALQDVRQDTAMNPEKPKYDFYGLGMGELDGWWGHTGEGLGYQAAVFRRPEDGAVIVVLVNSSQTDNVATEIFQALAAEVPLTS